MNEITTAITEIKTKISLEEWQQRIIDCQQSGMSIKAWCQKNGIATSSYYHYLRKIRESMLKEKQIVPLEIPKPICSTEIRIESGSITVTLPENVSTEQLTEPGEYTAGLKERTCSGCGDVESEAIPATGHIVHTPDDEWHIDDNNHWHVCVGEKCDEILDKAAHDYDDAADVNCNICGYERNIEHTHDWADEYSKDETYHWYDCSGCDEVNGKEAHNWDDGIVTKPASENETGIMTYTCEDCAQTKEDEIPALGHTHTYSSEWKSDADNHWNECTCGDKSNEAAHADENTDGECDVCEHEVDGPHNHEFSTEYESNADGHWHVCECGETTEVESHIPSDEATEESAQVCTECGYVIAPALEHTHKAISDEWESNEAEHWHECECGEKIDNDEHTAGDWIIDKNATVSSDGSRHKECTICGYILEIEALPALNDDSFDYDAWRWTMIQLYNRTYTITAEANEGGSITPAGNTAVKYNRNQTYTITPDDGYEIEAVLVNGKNVGAVSEYTFKGVKKDQTITVVFAEKVWENPYEDVAESDWFYEDVEYVTVNGLMNGVESDKFAPESALTRGMIVTVLWRLEGSPDVDFDMQFEDVEADAWYTEAIRWAAANGIVNGYGDGKFGPENDVTREQAAAILQRYAVYKGWDDGITLPMVPQYTYSTWAENSIIWADMNGLLDDIGEDTSDMTVAANRAEIAAYLRRFCENIAE